MLKLKERNKNSEIENHRFTSREINVPKIGDTVNKLEKPKQAIPDIKDTLSKMKAQNRKVTLYDMFSTLISHTDDCVC